MWIFLQGFRLRDSLPFRARQLEFLGLRSCSIICRMGLHRRLLPTMHERSHGFFSVEFYWLTGVETTYRCTSYRL
ncbi:hypothetical protein LINPERPRIM_LOCUS21937 [Linum perenne]